MRYLGLVFISKHLKKSRLDVFMWSVSGKQKRREKLIKFVFSLFGLIASAHILRYRRFSFFCQTEGAVAAKVSYLIISKNSFNTSDDGTFKIFTQKTEVCVLCGV